MSERPTQGDRERKSPLSTIGALPHTARLVAAESPEVAPSNVIHWGRERLRQTLPRVVSRCMSYSASPEFDEALTSAVSRFYGVDVDVATAETDVLEDDFERVRFFPWFLWDYPLPHASGLVHDELSFVTVGSRFLEQAELSDFEREVLCALTSSSLAFVEVMETNPAHGDLRVTDLARQDLVDVYDPGLAAELTVGHIALVRLIRFEGSAQADAALAAIDAIYAVLPHETRPLVEMELERILGGEREPLTVLKTHAPEILDFAEHVLSTLSEPPAPLNADREPLLLCQTVIARSKEARVLALLERGGPFSRVDSGDPIWVWREDARVVGLIVRNEGRVLVMASSRERFARVAHWFDLQCEPLPALRAEATLDAAGEGWLAGGQAPAWLLDPDVESCTRRALTRWISRWPDQPHPAVGGRTPRAMALEPGGREVVARLIARTRPIAGAETQALVDWLERTPVNA